MTGAGTEAMTGATQGTGLRITMRATAGTVAVMGAGIEEQIVFRRQLLLSALPELPSDVKVILSLASHSEISRPGEASLNHSTT